ncbi:competence protein comM, truncation [Wolbachia endosymbiont of Drosophila ananassae]|nr:competence protein comM, truncation [Wolbachia endosymbiont of Drosophila ananassae]
MLYDYTTVISDYDTAYDNCSHYDLAIAIGLLVVMNVIPVEKVQSYIIMGELALDSRVIPVSGVLPTAINAKKDNKGVICPRGNGVEAVWVKNVSILAIEKLTDIIRHFKGEQLIQPVIFNYSDAPKEKRLVPDMKDIKCQVVAKEQLKLQQQVGIICFLLALLVLENQCLLSAL